MTNYDVPSITFFLANYGTVLQSSNEFVINETSNFYLQVDPETLGNSNVIFTIAILGSPTDGIEIEYQVLQSTATVFYSFSLGETTITEEVSNFD